MDHICSPIWSWFEYFQASVRPFQLLFSSRVPVGARSYSLLKSSHRPSDLLLCSRPFNDRKSNFTVRVSALIVIRLSRCSKCRSIAETFTFSNWFEITARLQRSHSWCSTRSCWTGCGNASRESSTGSFSRWSGSKSTMRSTRRALSWNIGRPKSDRS